MDITRYNNLARLEDFYTRLNWDGAPFSAVERQDVYTLNNYFIPERYEHSMGCGSCDGRVKTKIFEFWVNQGVYELAEIKKTMADAIDEIKNQE